MIQIRGDMMERDKLEEEVRELKEVVEIEIKENKKLKEAVTGLIQVVNEMKEISRRGSELTGVRRQILELLEEQDESLSVKEVADLTGRAETTVSGYLHDLYESGYLERKSQLVDVGETRRVRRLEYSIPPEKRRRWHYL